MFTNFFIVILKISVEMKEILLNDSINWIFQGLKKTEKRLKFYELFFCTSLKRTSRFLILFVIPFSDFSLEHEITKEVRYGGLETKGDEELNFVGSFIR